MGPLEALDQRDKLRAVAAQVDHNASSLRKTDEAGFGAHAGEFGDSSFVFGAAASAMLSARLRIFPTTFLASK